MVDGTEPSPLGETLPESREEGRETEAGPSETEPLGDDLRDPCVDLDLDLGCRIAGGGNGGKGKIVGLSPQERADHVGRQTFRQLGRTLLTFSIVSNLWKICCDQ